MVNVNLLSVVNSSVDEGLAKIGLPNTPSNRLNVLMGMHAKIRDEGITHDDRAILQTIEDEVVRLDFEDEGL